MAIRVSTYTVNVGDSLQLSQTQGEDREHRFIFLDSVTGVPIDFTTQFLAVSPFESLVRF